MKYPIVKQENGVFDCRDRQRIENLDRIQALKEGCNGWQLKNNNMLTETAGGSC